MTFERPPLEYATAPDGVHLAYVRFGEGDHEIVLPCHVGADIKFWWTHPAMRAVVKRFAHFARVTIFDQRGCGSSGGSHDERRVGDAFDDVGTVLDAAGVERAALFGFLDAGATATAFAVAHPDRVSSLTTFGWNPRPMVGPDWPYGLTEDGLEEFLSAFERLDAHPWARHLFPSFVDDPELRRVWADNALGSRGVDAALARERAIHDRDHRHLLERIPVPTLILAPDRPDRPHGNEMGEHLAALIPDARLVRLPWPDMFPVDPHLVADEIEEFVTGRRPARPARRALATVLFTDIVGSTARAAQMGDADWRALLGRHDRALRDAVEAGRGTVVKTTGDGALVTFESATDAVAVARRLVAKLRDLGLEMRAGIHIGEVEIRGDDVGGIAVHIASRVQALAEPGGILVTRTVKDLTYGAGLEFEDRGTHELKGVPDPWQVLAVVDGSAGGG